MAMFRKTNDDDINNNICWLHCKQKQLLKMNVEVWSHDEMEL